MFSAVMAIRLRSASFDLYATCGVNTTWSGGTRKIGSFRGTGSVSNTSKPARKRRWLSKSHIASWSMTPPRATFTKTASGFNFSIKSLLTNFCVWAFKAMLTATTSLRSNNSSKPTSFPSIGALVKAGFSLRDHPRISAGWNARKSSAVRNPLSPRPKMPMVLFRISFPPAECAQPPQRMVRSDIGISRITAKVRPKESSATESVEYAGTFTTLMPLFLHASKSTWLKPVNETATNLHSGYCAKTSSVTGFTTVTSAHASGNSSGWCVTSKPFSLIAPSALSCSICMSCSKATFFGEPEAKARQLGAARP
mmetsp:Transcript_48506/g.113549  ORF Transcript_48506/g.113549 Transcript_48506/m.113549 type:complete len:310 (-) Transcript_48506:134-1063(-)